MNPISRILRRIRHEWTLLRKRPHWEEIEYFDPQWKQRIGKMATYLGECKSVVDLGCGPMWLRDFLPPQCSYYPVDYKDRGNGTLVCDFNRGEFPSVQADVAFVSGAMEYVHDYAWFVQSIAQISNKCILSYCTMDLNSNIRARKANAWVNHLSFVEVVQLFSAHGFQLQHSVTQSNSLFHFDK